MIETLKTLEPEFARKAKLLLQNCTSLGYKMEPVCGVRTPFEQAKLWRQSRSTREIHEKMEELQQNEAPFLARCIEEIGPCSGPHVTNAIPGFSWHQWGEALDCVWVVDGKVEWSHTKKVNGQNGYVVYTEQAVELGFIAGGTWRSFQDWPHIQASDLSSPARRHNLKEINDAMKKMYG